ncbi:helix-turn-helix domain-containing protein [Algoriphagus limi]|uniref:AraC family transcriptional regulator n=1 Tax=Algoriphagus limi TaxID=2975273 RepID=A0ABT2G6K0_9BACT|nr:AraC family transcriptional regulator [Algoriphagus limi]MCS5490895.1 AraC family transcriptional regulator [Algoriphagus limi]
MKFIGNNNQYLEISALNAINSQLIKNSSPSDLLVLWFLEDDNQLIIDNIDYTFNSNDLVFLTEFHKIGVKKFTKAKLLRWNKYFYCIINHDSEVGCKGILFYGAVGLPSIHLSQQNLDVFSTVWKMLEQEMVSKDSLQEEMLQMMLKRILILCTRIYKEQNDSWKTNTRNIDIIREYHFLVEQHFKEKHSVAEYADLLHKSPKSLSNLFKKLGSKTPLQFIKDRKMLEARRLLTYTDMTVSEIGYEIGFSDIQSFSRFFKNEEGMSPIDFRKR